MLIPNAFLVKMIEIFCPIYALLCIKLSSKWISLAFVRWMEPSSIPGRACRPSRSKLTVFLSKTRVKKGLESFRKTLPHGGHLTSSPRPLM